MCALVQRPGLHLDARDRGEKAREGWEPQSTPLPGAGSQPQRVQSGVTSEEAVGGQLAWVPAPDVLLEGLGVWSSTTPLGLSPHLNSVEWGGCGLDGLLVPSRTDVIRF